MSADDGVLIRYHKGKYVVQTYFASEDSYPSIHKAPDNCKYDTLQEAIMSNQSLISESEYGLKIQTEWAIYS